MPGITCYICKVITFMVYSNFKRLQRPISKLVSNMVDFCGILDFIFFFEIQEKFNFYKSKISSQSITQPRLLTFCSKLRIPWILTWNIIKKQEQPPSFPLSISKEFNIKWYDKFNQEFVCQQKILQIISRPESSNSKDSANSCKWPTQAKFLTLKSNVKLH